MLWQPSLPEKYLAASPESLAAQITQRRRQLGDDLIILGHHYQTDEVIRHADFTGDSLKLSQIAAREVEKRSARFVVFCGVHFMAETADMLTPDDVAVILPDLSAGCSMADMADYDDAAEAWRTIHETLHQHDRHARVIPITYVNSTAAIKAFVGANGGACCTSSNAANVFDWALHGGDCPTSTPAGAEDIKILFLPDQHLGRNTAAAAGINVTNRTCVYDPKAARRGDPLGGATPDQISASRVILWAGHCSVHKLFRPEHCDQIIEQNRKKTAANRTRILVHPECTREVVEKSDLTGSTEFIIRTIREAPSGSHWAIGTEVHLVSRLAREAARRGVHVRILSDCQCLCTTMYRIDQPHLLWALDNLAAGKVVNRVRVHPEARRLALVALERMLSLAPGAVAAGV